MADLVWVSELAGTVALAAGALAGVVRLELVAFWALLVLAVDALAAAVLETAGFFTPGAEGLRVDDFLAGAGASAVFTVSVFGVSV
ncbi:hypothetical protein [Maricaulis sp. D1M11]|uniref:hypothetical protein n=1 Tax=Maricaulis sp. D1M11 TaxID=3076117 RepID=UPI0039B37AD3